MLYITTTFLSAFLLFMVQLLMGKLLLPWFGGTPSVWTTCMLFFQLTLLAGYAYAHLSSAYLTTRSQIRLHLALLATCIALMAVWLVRSGSPILPDNSWKPAGTTNPQPLILTILSLSVGLPFLLLSATSPLLQRWFSLAGHGAKTYRLYAVSNAGSLLGLLSYPFLIERFLTLPTQAVVWATAFLLFAAGCATLALQLRRGLPRSPTTPATPTPAPSSTSPHHQPACARPGTVITWLALSTSTSAMLLSVTNELCQEIASVPFLWIIPLSIYLLSFIICFDHPRWYHRRGFLAASAVLTLTVLITASLGISLKIPTHIAAFSLFLFTFCMTCHGELFRLRPQTHQLTLFYLCISIGGAAGGLFVGLAAPHLFTSYWEFNITATLAWAALAFVFLRDRNSLFYTGDWLHLALFTAFALYMATRITLTLHPAFAEIAWNHHLLLTAAITLALSFALLWPARRSRFANAWFWPRLMVGTVVFMAECFMVMRIREINEFTVTSDRNFFGTLRVSLYPAVGDSIPAHVQLTHGQINHGVQYLSDELRNTPVSYYGEHSGIHTAITRHARRAADPENPQPLNIGVLGLGTGNMAAFAQPGDSVRFYEINPTVVDYSTRENPYFTYLRDCPGETSIVTGDARLALERELAAGQPQQFDILVMDAFSSDSVPVHLLTIEAFELYRQHLRDLDSIIAVNISNRFLDLADLVATQSDSIGFAPIRAEIPIIPPTTASSNWMLLTRSEHFLDDPVVHQRARPNLPQHRIAWTDSFSNLFQVLR